MQYYTPPPSPFSAQITSSGYAHRGPPAPPPPLPWVYRLDPITLLFLLAAAVGIVGSAVALITWAAA